MADQTLTPPPPSAAQYWLKTDEENPKYLRLFGNGINSVVLTEGAPPKFLRWEHIVSSSDAPTGKEIAISWKSDPGRFWGLVLQPPREKYGWEEVRIVEGEGKEGFVWVKEGEREVLKWEGAVKGEGGVEAGWKGWIVCPWAHGHPQLFWVTGLVDKDLPPFCEKVDIIREWLVPRE